MYMYTFKVLFSSPINNFVIIHTLQTRRLKHILTLLLSSSFPPHTSQNLKRLLHYHFLLKYRDLDMGNAVPFMYT